MTLSQMIERRDELLAEAGALVDTGEVLTGESAERFDEMETELRRLDERIDRERIREARAAEMIARVRNGTVGVEHGADLGDDAPRSPVYFNRTANPWTAGDLWETPTQTRARAEAAIARWNAADELKHDAARTLHRVEGSGAAEHILLTSSPDYCSAWRRFIRDPQGFGAELTPAERAAWGRVRDYQHRAALATTGAVMPSPLDPSIVLTNTGVADAMRSVARIETTTALSKRFITSAGVTASYDAELAEVSDDTPSLTEVEIETEMARAFVQASIEAAADQPNFDLEVARMFADAKQRLEADKFANGSGTNEPTGIITSLDGSASEVAPATAETFVAADVYATIEALPPRWRPNATWMAELSTWNEIDQFETTNGAKLFPDIGSANPRLLRRPALENSSLDAWSAFDAGATSDHFLLLVGDFRQFVILDRIGLTVEFIPHMLNASNNLPDGRRGWFAFWRSSSKVLTVDAFRVLSIPTTA